MSIIQKISPKILPVSEAYAMNRGMQGPKLYSDVYANEGQSLFGYNASSAQKQMSFTIGSNNASWLADESFLEFDVKISAGTTGIKSGNASALFSRVRLISQQGAVLFDEQASNLYQRIIQNVVVGDNHKASLWSSLGSNLGVAEASCQTITSTAVHVVLPLQQAIFKQIKSFPLPVMGNLRLILDMAPDTECFGILGTSTTYYRVDNPRLNCVFQPLEFEYIDKMKKVAAAGGMMLNYSQTYYVSGSAAATANTLAVNYAMRSVRKVVAVHRLSAQLADYTMDSLNKAQAAYGGLTNVQVRIGSDSFPTVAIDSTERAYTELRKTLGIYGDLDSSNQITRLRYTAADNTGANQGSIGPLFIVGISLDNESLNTGVSTVSGALLYRYNQVTALAGLQADVFVVYDCTVLIRSPSEMYLEY